MKQLFGVLIIRSAEIVPKEIHRRDRTTEVADRLAYVNYVNSLLDAKRHSYQIKVRSHVPKVEFPDEDTAQVQEKPDALIAEFKRRKKDRAQRRKRNKAK